MKMRKV